jgi:hypothetical protein
MSNRSPPCGMWARRASHGRPVSTRWPVQKRLPLLHSSPIPQCEFDPGTARSLTKSKGLSTPTGSLHLVIAATRHLVVKFHPLKEPQRLRWKPKSPGFGEGGICLRHSSTLSLLLAQRLESSHHSSFRFPSERGGLPHRNLRGVSGLWQGVSVRLGRDEGHHSRPRSRPSCTCAGPQTRGLRGIEPDCHRNVSAASDRAARRKSIIYLQAGTSDRLEN